MIAGFVDRLGANPQSRPTTIIVSDHLTGVRKGRVTHISRNQPQERSAVVNQWARVFSVLDGAGAGSDAAAGIAKHMFSIAQSLKAAAFLPPRITIEDNGEVDFIWDEKTRFFSLTLNVEFDLIGYYHAEGMSDALRLDEPFSATALETFIAYAA